jgi:hypothetical protein
MGAAPASGARKPESSGHRSRSRGTKAALVILYFLHVRYASKRIWIFSIAGFVWLVLSSR